MRSPTSPSRSLGSSRSGKALAVCSASADKLASWLKHRLLALVEQLCLTTQLLLPPCELLLGPLIDGRSLLLRCRYPSFSLLNCRALGLLGFGKSLGANTCGFGEVGLQAICRLAVVLRRLGKQCSSLLLRFDRGRTSAARPPVPARQPPWIWLLRPRAQQCGAGSRCRGRHSGALLVPHCRPRGGPTRLAAEQPQPSDSASALALSTWALTSSRNLLRS